MRYSMILTLQKKHTELAMDFFFVTSFWSIDCMS